MRRPLSFSGVGRHASDRTAACRVSRRPPEPYSFAPSVERMSERSARSDSGDSAMHLQTETRVRPLSSRRLEDLPDAARIWPGPVGLCDIDKSPLVDTTDFILPTNPFDEPKHFPGRHKPGSAEGAVANPLESLHRDQMPDHRPRGSATNWVPMPSSPQTSANGSNRR